MRARNLKPGFFRNEQLAECSAFARLLFQSLWLMADREGRLEYRPRRWKGEAFPYDNLDIETLFSEIEAVGLVLRYELDGQAYVWIPNFKKHQSPHFRESPSIIPPHPQDNTQDSPGQARGKPESSPSPDLGKPPLNPDILNPDILNPEEENTVGPKDGPPPQRGFSGFTIYHQAGAMHISQRDFDSWERAYTNIDLRAELQKLSDWTKTTREWGKKEAFHACSAALAKKNGAAFEAHREQSRPSAMCAVN